MVEDDFEGASVVVDLKQRAHRLFELCGDAPYYNNLWMTQRQCYVIIGSVSQQYTYFIDGVAINLADVIGARRRLLDHLECHGRKDSVLAALLAAKVAASRGSSVTALEVGAAADVVGEEAAIAATSKEVLLSESLVVAGEHFLRALYFVNIINYK